MTTAQLYPYTAGNGTVEECKYNTTLTPPAVELEGYYKPTANDMHKLLDVLVNVGPVVVSGYANLWKSYEFGVFDDCDIALDINVDHAIVMEGYGVDESLGDYWLIRNSWGEDFGENGYIRLRKEDTPECGTDHNPGSGSACEGDG